MMGAKENGYKRKPHDACGVHCEANIPGREVLLHISLHHYIIMSVKENAYKHQPQDKFRVYCKTNISGVI